jgi:SHS2 domain-containing protein
MGYEVLEHTADVGLRATAATLPELFAEATRGMAELAGVWAAGSLGDEVAIEAEAGDLEGLLVEWLGEVLYVHDSRNAALHRVTLDEVSETSATGKVLLSTLSQERAEEGTQIKAVTFHQLEVRRTTEGWTARVFFDI